VRGLPALRVRLPAQGHPHHPGHPFRRTPGEAKVEKEPATFEIDMLRCIYCGLCEEACPEEAIFLKKDFAVTGYTREEMVFDKKRLLELGGIREDSIRKWEKK
jgi:NADH-quinone oxidoreductase subunit I